MQKLIITLLMMMISRSRNMLRKEWVKILMVEDQEGQVDLAVQAVHKVVTAKAATLNK